MQSQSFHCISKHIPENILRSHQLYHKDKIRISQNKGRTRDFKPLSLVQICQCNGSWLVLDSGSLRRLKVLQTRRTCLRGSLRRLKVLQTRRTCLRGRASTGLQHLRQLCQDTCPHHISCSCQQPYHLRLISTIPQNNSCSPITW
jgi:hypothetical protein